MERLRPQQAKGARLHPPQTCTELSMVTALWFVTLIYAANWCNLRVTTDTAVLQASIFSDLLTC